MPINITTAKMRMPLFGPTYTSSCKVGVQYYVGHIWSGKGRVLDQWCFCSCTYGPSLSTSSCGLAIRMAWHNQLCMLVEYDSPSKTNQMLFSIFTTSCHGSFTLVHSIVNKIWHQNTKFRTPSLEHQLQLVSLQQVWQCWKSHTVIIRTCWMDIDQ